MSGPPGPRIPTEIVNGGIKYIITKEQLELLTELKCTGTEMAEFLGVRPITIYRRLRHFGMSRKDRFTDIGEEQLAEAVVDVKGNNKKIGPNNVRSRLRTEKGIEVQRQKVRNIMELLYPGEAAMRALAFCVERQIYHVAGPNSLWHLDGNHKLVHWNIIIHGCVDGYSRVITFLGAAANNKAATVMHRFLESTAEFGTPSRIRVDQGVENTQVVLYMNSIRGFFRGSAIIGKSCHNQRIERSWIDAWSNVTHLFYELFRELEAELLLDRNDVADIWLLQNVFLPEINLALAHHKDAWNFHEMSSVKGNKLPANLFFKKMALNNGTNLTAARDFFDREGKPMLMEGEEAVAVTEELIQNLHGRSRVDVPSIDCPLSHQKEQYILESIAQVETSNDYGRLKYIIGYHLVHNIPMHGLLQNTQ